MEVRRAKWIKHAGQWPDPPRPGLQFVRKLLASITDHVAVMGLLENSTDAAACLARRGLGNREFIDDHMHDGPHGKGSPSLGVDEWLGVRVSPETMRAIEQWRPGERSGNPKLCDF